MAEKRGGGAQKAQSPRFEGQTSEAFWLPRAASVLKAAGRLESRALFLTLVFWKARARDAMQRTLLKSKIHRATVTQADLHYEGSVTIDQQLLEAADILVHERIEVYNIDNGERFSTYAIPGAPGSGVICINGAAAHLAKPGHKVIIASYVVLNEADARSFQPKVILVDDRNHPKSSANHSGGAHTQGAHVYS
ncbi:MAG: Aspartate 1-decarboxylase precursor [Pseudomonadota bacterium]|jgi:aspartate 1-decarboxylase